MGIGTEDFVFVYLARKSVVKGIKSLFEAFSRIAHFVNVKLLFIGPDESNGVLDELYRTYSNISDKIISLDIVDAHYRYLAISDVLCLPSSREGFRSIVIEAASLEVPAIGYRIVGLSDAIADGTTGILVEPNNVEQFAMAMLDLYTDSTKLQQMKKNARERALSFFDADVVYTYQKRFYESLLKMRAY